MTLLGDSLTSTPAVANANTEDADTSQQLMRLFTGPYKSALRKTPAIGSRGHVSFDRERPDQLAHEAQACHRRGNEVSVKKVVDGLYQRVLHDEMLRPFFCQGMDMQHLVDMQHKLMTYVFGGSELLQLSCPNFDLRSSHMHSLVTGGLSMQHWEAFARHFRDTLDDLPEIPAETKASALAWMQSTRGAFRPPAQEELEAYKRVHVRPGSCPFH